MVKRMDFNFAVFPTRHYILLGVNSFAQENSIYIDYPKLKTLNQLNSLRNLRDVKSIYFNNPTNLKLFSEHLLIFSQIEDYGLKNNLQRSILNE